MKFISLTIILIFSLATSAYSKRVKVIDVPTDTYKVYIPDGMSLTQTKNGLTVEIIPLNPGLMHKYPKLFSWEKDRMPADWKINLSTFYVRNTDDGKYYEYPFGAGGKFLNVYLIKITNKTGHIIRMSGVHIYLLVNGENPIRPVTNFGNASLVDVTPADASIYKTKTLLPQSYIANDGSLVNWVTWIWGEWAKTRKKGFISFVYPIGLPSQILLQNRRSYNLINDVNSEVLPDFSYSGILLFPRLIKDNVIDIKMYDFPTKTDAAGNVTERSNFDFRLKLADGIMYYDLNTKKWIQGEPPQKVEYYNRKQKKWIYGIPKK